MTAKSFSELFTRCKSNPLITAKDIPYRINSVFNAGATSIENETLLLMRTEDRRGISHLTAARSRDGITGWRIDPEPTLLECPESYPEESWGIEDPRITYLEEMGLWTIVYTSYSSCGPLVSLACTRDFKKFDRKGIILPPENKDVSLFPVRFNGQWAMLHRPVTGSSGAHIWISFSPDMTHWGNHQLLIPARDGAWWDAGKIGASPPPVLTEKGWLIIYHGVKKTVSGCIYRLGLALLDLKDPRKLLARSDEWVFAPEESYEMTGDVDKVVFSNGCVSDGKKLNLYYGGADKCICLATADIAELLEWLGLHTHSAETVNQAGRHEIDQQDFSGNRRPWGFYEVISDNPDHKLKRITVYPDQRLSLQRHFRRSEHWYVIKGQAKVVLDGREIPLASGQAVDIPVKSWHRIQNTGAADMVFVEVQTGEYFGEDDIERGEDDYGRAK